MVAHPDVNPTGVNFGDQMGTGVFSWTSQLTNKKMNYEKNNSSFLHMSQNA